MREETHIPCLIDVRGIQWNSSNIGLLYTWLVFHGITGADEHDTRRVKDVFMMSMMIYIELTPNKTFHLWAVIPERPSLHVISLFEVINPLGAQEEKIKLEIGL